MRNYLTFKNPVNGGGVNIKNPSNFFGKKFRWSKSVHWASQTEFHWELRVSSEQFELTWWWMRFCFTVLWANSWNARSTSQHIFFTKGKCILHYWLYKSQHVFRTSQIQFLWKLAVVILMVFMSLEHFQHVMWTQLATLGLIFVTYIRNPHDFPAVCLILRPASCGNYWCKYKANSEVYYTRTFI